MGVPDTFNRRALVQSLDAERDVGSCTNIQSHLSTFSLFDSRSSFQSQHLSPAHDLGNNGVGGDEDKKTSKYLHEIRPVSEPSLLT
jgi:hypothetical protein